MQEKLKTILHTIWNEPRHFFLWLAMLSICGLAAVAAGAILTGPTLLLAFLMTGCAWCLLVSIPAFILSWIPPVRRLFAWLLRRKMLSLGCLVILIALFYSFENWRGRRAWQSFKQEREAKGERFDAASFIPPPVPDDRNFFETPLWTNLHFVQTNGAIVWSDTNRANHAIFDAFGPEGHNAPNPGRWSKAERVDLEAWQKFYRGSNNVFAADQAAADAFRKRYGLDWAPVPAEGIPGIETAPTPVSNSPTTNYFPIAREPQTPAADVLLALSRFETNRQLLIAAAARPQARFWINYGAGFGALIPHLARIKASAQYLSLHASAALKAGDRDTALEDVKLSFRLIESIRNEPTLISHLVRIATQALAMQPVWEGLADRQWTEAELRVIESELGKLDFLADYHFAMRCERAWNVWAVDYIRKQGMLELDAMVSPQRKTPPMVVMGNMVGIRLIPAGWFDQNKLSLCRLYEKYLLPRVAVQDRRVDSPASIRESNSPLTKQRLRPYDMLSRILLPALDGTAERCAQGQTFTDLARIACALERYRLASGQFPETLAELAPKFIEKLPHDVINGQPLNYRRTDDGRFVLYSVGWNETDDGGKIGLTKNGNLDRKQGDWVWQYPAS